VEIYYPKNLKKKFKFTDFPFVVLESTFSFNPKLINKKVEGGGWLLHQPLRADLLKSKGRFFHTLRNEN
jgi:hypothetical protein